MDLVLWGASGFTGRLVAAHLLARHGASGALRWGLGGRNAEKLEAVRAEIEKETGIAAGALPIVVGDAQDEAFLEELTGRARVVCSTVGPYALYGSKLVAACARSGTHYCDLTGEMPWMRRMIDAHEAEAQRSGARLVHNCGFDSIPSDLGVFFLQREMRRRHGVPCARIKGRVAGFSGGASGGTIASMLNMMEEAGRDKAMRRVMADPYGLNPADQRSGPDGPDLMTPAWDEDFEAWIGPFVMAGINTRVVRRSNALLGNRYGDDFRYDEATLMGEGPLGLARAAALTAGLGTALLAGGVTPLRNGMRRFLPDPGEGPSREKREAGYFDLRFFGEHPGDRGKSLRARVTGDRDPGYGSTAKMLGEAAACLAQDDLEVDGGFWTPASGLGEALLERLERHAGIAFTIEEK